jgi:hypothetical protein
VQSTRKLILDLFEESIANLENQTDKQRSAHETEAGLRTVSGLSMIYSMAREIRNITSKMSSSND